ncbi:hypothetical protein Bbelb_141030 [Branchiostoma belcheri]|nr:hypothetical protein Bbelb_141030 [Branchiostoma belcheri]
MSASLQETNQRLGLPETPDDETTTVPSGASSQKASLYPTHTNDKTQWGRSSPAGGVVSSGRSLGDIFAAFRAAPPQGSISPSQAADLDYVDTFQSGRTYNYYISTVY